MTRDEVIDYLYDMNCHADVVIEKMADDLMSPQWIPCSESLPKEEGYFFVTDEAAGMAETLIDKYLRCDDGEWVWLYSQHAVAWMPLPEPYQEGGQDETD